MQATQLAFSQSSILFETLAEKIYIEPYYTSLRETLANALDIHKVVGTDRKVDMDLSSVKSNGMVLVTIRDYGTGIAPESYHEAYTFFGSNKAVSQEKQSGEYGLGAKSPYGILYRNNKLDYKIDECNSFTVTSFNQGKKYIRIHHLDQENIPSYSTISVTDTTEPDGLMVQFVVRETTIYDLVFPNNTFALSFFDKVNITFDTFSGSNNAVSKKFSHITNEIQKFKRYPLFHGVDAVLIPSENLLVGTKNGMVFFQKGDIVYEGFGSGTWANCIMRSHIADYVIVYIVDVHALGIPHNIPSSRDGIYLDSDASEITQSIYNKITGIVQESDVTDYIKKDSEAASVKCCVSDVRAYLANIEKSTAPNLKTVLAKSESIGAKLPFARKAIIHKELRETNTICVATGKGVRSIGSTGAKISGGFLNNESFKLFNCIQHYIENGVIPTIIIRGEVRKYKPTMAYLLGSSEATNATFILIDSLSQELKQSFEQLHIEYKFMCDIEVPKASRTRAINKVVDNTVSRIVVNEHYIKSKAEFNSLIKHNYPTFFVSGVGDVRESAFSSYRYDVKTKKYGVVSITPVSAHTSNYTISYTDSSGEKFTQKISANIIALPPTTNRTTAQTMDVIIRHMGNGSIKRIEDIELDVKKENATPLHTLFLLVNSSIRDMSKYEHTIDMVRMCHLYNAQNGANLVKKFVDVDDNINYIPDYDYLDKVEKIISEMDECDLEFLSFVGSSQSYNAVKLRKNISRIVTLVDKQIGDNNLSSILSYNGYDTF